jgi:hypothetical protein
MKGIKKHFIPPFFVSMATAAKFVQLIPIFSAFEGLKKFKMSAVAMVTKV